MPTHSIEYLNARAAFKPASGGKNYAKHDRAVNAAAERERFAALDAFQQIQERAHARFAEQRRIIAEFRVNWQAGRYTTAQIEAHFAETEIPF